MVPEWAGRLWTVLLALSALFWAFVLGVPSLKDPGMVRAWLGATAIPPTALVLFLVLLSWMFRGFRRSP